MKKKPILHMIGKDNGYYLDKYGNKKYLKR